MAVLSAFHQKNPAYLSVSRNAQVGQEDGNDNYKEAAPLAFCGDIYHYLHAPFHAYDSNDSTAAQISITFKGSNPCTESKK